MTAPPLQAFVIAPLSAIGLALSAYVAYRSGRRRPLPGCGPKSACDAVLNSRWSRWLGLPVALPAAVVYGGIVGATAVTTILDPADPLRESFHATQVVLALLAAGAALWFVGLQALAIRRVCIYCNVLHAIGIAVCGMKLYEVGVPSIMSVGLAAAGVLLLIAGQLLVRPNDYAIDHAAELPTPPRPALQEQPSESEPVRAPPIAAARSNRVVSLLGGKITLNVGDWPRLVGSADARHVLAYLFDYTCPACRSVHRFLREAVPQSGLDIVVLTIPAPVDPACNPHVQRRAADHACCYARLGLAVWRANREKFAEFDRFMFEGDHAPPPDVALARGRDLLGATHLDPESPDGDLDGLIARGVAMHQTAGSRPMPTLLLPKAIVSGQVPSAGRLAEILREQFAIS